MPLNNNAKRVSASSANGLTAISDGVTLTTKATVKPSGQYPTNADSPLVVTLGPSSTARGVSQLSTGYAAVGAGTLMSDTLGRLMVNDNAPPDTQRIFAFTGGGNVPIIAQVNLRFVINRIIMTAANVVQPTITFSGLDPARNNALTGFSLAGSGSGSNSIVTDFNLSDTPIYGALNTLVQLSFNSGNISGAVFGHWTYG
jgi:hypothetical protein